MPPGSDNQAAPIGMIEQPDSVQVTYAMSDNKRPSTGEGALQQGKSHQVIHSNSVKNPTEINLYTETLAPTSGKEHDVPSQPSCLIPEYVNLHILGIRRIKIIQERNEKGNDIPKLFGLVDLFTYVAMSDTKYILQKQRALQQKIYTTNKETSPLNTIYPTLITPWYQTQNKDMTPPP